MILWVFMVFVVEFVLLHSRRGGGGRWDRVGMGVRAEKFRK